MRMLPAALTVLALAACGDPAPAPKPAAAPPPPAAPAPKAAEAPAPEVKTAEALKPDPDQELARKVKRALEGETKILAAAIDVTARGGRVTLWGTTATAGERTRAAQVAAKVEGVSSVDNKLQVVKGS